MLPTLATDKDIGKASLRELIRKRFECSKGSKLYNVLTDAIEARMLWRDTVQKWTFFIVGAMIGIAGLMLKFIH